jgi:hypothetical protein
MPFGASGEFVGAPSVTSGGGGGSGTVTSVSVVSANGLAGSVATATTTPAITLSTSITGVLTGNGTAISAATITGSGGIVVESVSPALTGTPTAPTATAGTNTTQIATTAFVQAAVTDLPNALTTSTITSDPAPAVIGTYYRCNYTGNLTLPTSPATGSWVMAKCIGAHTLTVVGTVDGTVNPTAVQNVSYWMIYNGTSWDFI